jgi:hypothetical protein
MRRVLRTNPHELHHFSQNTPLLPESAPIRDFYFNQTAQHFFDVQPSGDVTASDAARVRESSKITPQDRVCCSEYPPAHIAPCIPLPYQSTAMTLRHSALKV